MPELDNFAPLRGQRGPELGLNGPADPLRIQHNILEEQVMLLIGHLLNGGLTRKSCDGRWSLGRVHGGGASQRSTDHLPIGGLVSTRGC